MTNVSPEVVAHTSNDAATNGRSGGKNTTPLKFLEIANLRGCVEPFTLAFETGKKLTIIYGPNGAGKTTICDALEFLCKGDVRSIVDCGLGAGLHKYWATLGQHSSAITVSLKTANDECVVKFVGTQGVCTAGPEKQPKVEVLRRTQIMGLLVEQPQRRYEAVKQFIDVTDIEKCESQLYSQVKVRKAALNDYANEAATHEQYILSNFPVGDGSISDAVKTARTFLEDNLDNRKADEKALRAMANCLRAIGDTYEGVVREAAAEQEIMLAASNAQELAATVFSQAIGGASELVDILQTARHLFANQPEISECPLCESSENVTGLAERIDKRLIEFQAVEKHKSEARKHSDALIAAQIRLQSANNNLNKAITQFAASIQKREWPGDWHMPETPASGLESVRGWLAEHAHLVNVWTEECDQLVKRATEIRQLQESLKNYDGSAQKCVDLERTIKRLDIALEIMKDERRRFTDGILESIAAKVGELYEKVHPDEGLSEISLQLQQNKRASLDIGSVFEDRTLPPQAYYSQSHLDTLGICIFLALHSKESPAETILIFDDVLSSVDEPHVTRLVSMLYEEGAKFRHCLLTTHYRPWKERFMWGELKERNCQFVELGEWSKTSGISIRGSYPEVSLLKKYLNAEYIDRQAIVGKAGVILECILNWLTVQYGCRIARKNSTIYTLSELFGAIDKKLMNSLTIKVTDTSTNPPAEVLSTELGPLLATLKEWTQARNIIGAHYNDVAMQLSEDEARFYGEKVLELANVVVDPDGGWPNKDKSGSYWECSGGTRRLYPLGRPS